jgi:hypothetical protein
VRGKGEWRTGKNEGDSARPLAISRGRLPNSPCQPSRREPAGRNGPSRSRPSSKHDTVRSSDHHSRMAALITRSTPMSSVLLTPTSSANRWRARLIRLLIVPTAMPQIAAVSS